MFGGRWRHAKSDVFAQAPQARCITELAFFQSGLSAETDPAVPWLTGSPVSAAPYGSSRLRAFFMPGAATGLSRDGSFRASSLLYTVRPHPAAPRSTPATVPADVWWLRHDVGPRIQPPRYWAKTHRLSTIGSFGTSNLLPFFRIDTFPVTAFAILVLPGWTVFIRSQMASLMVTAGHLINIDPPNTEAASVMPLFSSGRREPVVSGSAQAQAEL